MYFFGFDCACDVSVKKLRLPREEEADDDGDP